MSRNEPDWRPQLFCPRCKASIVWPLSLSADDKARTATEVRASAMAGAKWLHERFGLELGEAKALSFHVTRTVGQCHRCHRALQGEASICRQCRSANLDW
ncbi:MAG TPA: hypothetical protein VLX44_17540 [Xanthobacteraceae bacterium]|nr:hypothetical protein [Xanthobacteraceae bacterium]